MSQIEVKRGLEHPEGVIDTRKQWKSLPAYMLVCEYAGTGDSYFGGNADDRVLGVDGALLQRQPLNDQAVAVFDTIDKAHEVAKGIPNRREGSVLGVMPVWPRQIKHPRLINKLKSMCLLTEGEAIACLDRREPEAVRHLGGWQQAVRKAFQFRHCF